MASLNQIGFELLLGPFFHSRLKAYAPVSINLWGSGDWGLKKIPMIKIMLSNGSGVVLLMMNLIVFSSYGINSAFWSLDIDISPCITSIISWKNLLFILLSLCLFLSPPTGAGFPYISIRYLTYTPGVWLILFLEHGPTFMDMVWMWECLNRHVSKSLLICFKFSSYQDLHLKYPDSPQTYMCWTYSG